MGISDYLVRIEELTNTNLKILEALNNSFYTSDNSITVDLGGDNVFNVPSFISLENKINVLQDNFENLINAPESSEARFILNGDSRTIEVKKYEQSPAPLVLEGQSYFYHEDNDVFKDFLTPVPYLKIDLSAVPNDITSVVFRKVVPSNTELINRFTDYLGNNSISANVNWGDINKILEGYKEDKDYVMYDTVQKLPIRTGQGTGSYVITSIEDDYIDENLDQHIIVNLANNVPGYQESLTYLLFDQTIERNLSVGDFIVSWSGKAKFVIEELNFNTNTIKMKVVYGDYANLFPWGGSGLISDQSKLRFFSQAGLFNDEKFAKIPLEEDPIIYVAIAPLNDRMNIRAPWGDGLVVDTTQLVSEDGQQTFVDYYKNCRNIGDTLNEISTVMSNTASSHTDAELTRFMNAKPEIDTDILKVVHINKHLDESTTIKNIRTLYSQKNNYNASLTETQNSLTALQEQLATIDFQDTTGVRAQLQNQIDTLSKKKNELINSLIKISNEIALEANNSVVPIENAKYRIRGFFDFIGFVQDLQRKAQEEGENININEGNIKGISVQYRYRNLQLETGSATTFVKDRDGSGTITDDETFIYSDWNQLHTFLRPKLRTKDGEYIPEPDNSNQNVPSFNQIDIPISQGEVVDVRLKVIYDFGYPFIQMTSDWSKIVTFEFPVEFMKDVDVVDIIEENNSDIETNRFNSILKDEGITDHVNDSILDQDVIFYHKPENISSGFYTNERRIIPLRDKLKDMNDIITRLADEIEGTTAEALTVNVDFDESTVLLSPFEIGNVMLGGYTRFSSISETQSVGNYEWDKTNGVVSIMCNIRLTNTTDHSLKLFSMFPATDNIPINNLTNYRFKKEDYSSGTGDNSKGVWIHLPKPDENDSYYKLQTSNQIITFRINNPYDGTEYYATGNQFSTNNVLSLDKDKVDLNNNKGMSIYPCNVKTDGLLMTYKEARTYMLMNPGDEIIIPLMVKYKLDNTSAYQSIQKTICFDIRTSLYDEPSNYIVKIGAKYQDTPSDKLVSALNKKYQSNVLKTREYKTVVR